MKSKRLYRKPDFSDYVIHFTKGGAPISQSQHPSDGIVQKVSGMTAKDRLYSILSDRCISATRMPWTNCRAVCFTESTWQGLLFHSKQYSEYGIGFSKSFLFSLGGGPAVYLRPELLAQQKAHVGAGKSPFDSTVYAFITPFCPTYAPKGYIKTNWHHKPVDYSHEREWRVPADLRFSYSDVAFVIVGSYVDMAQAPQQFKDEIGRTNWIIMDIYEKVEELWPIHAMPLEQ